jgi:hypothetical protein
MTHWARPAPIDLRQGVPLYPAPRSPRTDAAPGRESDGMAHGPDGAAEAAGDEARVLGTWKLGRQAGLARESPDLIGVLLVAFREENGSVL